MEFEVGVDDLAGAGGAAGREDALMPLTGAAGEAFVEAERVEKDGARLDHGAETVALDIGIGRRKVRLEAPAIAGPNGR